MKKEIQVLRDKLNAYVNNEPLNSECILRLSLELDKLILEYYRNNLNK